MGCFNASCAVSHCSINPGDEVKMIPIVSNNPIHDMFELSMHNGFGCYPWDNFSFVGYPMSATYDDYGNYVVQEDMFSKYNLAVIRENYTENVKPEDKEESTFNDEGYGIPADTLEWNNIIGMIHHGCMYLDSNSTRTKRRYLGMFPVHKCVYDLMMNRSPEMYLGDTYGKMSYDNFLTRHLAENNRGAHVKEFNELVTKYMDQFSPLINQKNKAGELITPELILEKAENMARLDMEMKNMRGGSDRREYSYNNSTSIKAFNKYLVQNSLPELTEDEHVELVKLDAEVVFFVGTLNAFQIPILPPMTAGQQYDKTEHASFLIACGQALLEMEDAEEMEAEYGYRVNVDTNITVSLKTLRENAKDHWRKEKGIKIVAEIDSFVEKYPEGATLTSSEMCEQGYGNIIDEFETTLFPFVIVNDIEGE